MTNDRLPIILSDRDVAAWREIFRVVNAGCVISGESVVPFTDTEYYAQQIVNLCHTDDYDVALAIAKELAK